MSVYKIWKKVAEDCLALKEKEKVLIITDNYKLPIADKLAKFYTDQEAEVTLWMIPESLRPLKYLNTTLQKLLKNSDVTNYLMKDDPREINFRHQIVEYGKNFGRIIMMPGVDEEMILNAVDISYEELKKVNKEITNELKNYKELKITNSLGTDIKIEITGDFVKENGEYHELGTFGNLPTGQVYSHCNQNMCEGVAYTKHIGNQVFNDPVKLEFQKGFLKNYETTDEQLKQLEDLLSAYNSEKNIAMMGIGTNPKAKLGNHVLETMRKLGSINLSLTEKNFNKNSINLPFVIEKPTLSNEKKIIIDEGNFNF